MKKILFLGGAYSQVPAIKYAKEQGYYVITVDYLPENPGHRISDEYYNISTIDKEEILNLSKRLRIDAISSFASDPAAPTAAYVSEKLNLTGSTYRSVKILSNKNLFRKFLQKNGFLVPWFFSSKKLSKIVHQYYGKKAILKPIDSSGSKGIFIIKNQNDLTAFFPIAKDFSRTGEVILEQYIERKGPQIHGEGFVINGKLVFAFLGDQVFSTVNSVVPYSTMVPSIYHQDIMDKAFSLVQQVLSKIGFGTGGINIELIRDKNDNLYVLEIGARNGGNFMPQLVYHKTKVDLVKANIDTLFNLKTNFNYAIDDNIHYVQVILHSKTDGIYEGLCIPEELKNNVVEQILYYQPGSYIHQYRNSKDVAGVIIFKLTNNIDTFNKFLFKNEWIKVIQ